MVLYVFKAQAATATCHIQQAYPGGMCVYMYLCIVTVYFIIKFCLPRVVYGRHHLATL